MIFINQLLGYLDIPGYLCRKIGFMKKNKPYKEQEPMVPNVGEPVVVYTGNENNPNIVTEGRDDIRHAISGEELLDRLCPRIRLCLDESRIRSRSRGGFVWAYKNTC